MRAKLLIVCGALAAMSVMGQRDAQAAQDPFFIFDFGDYEGSNSSGGDFTHTDTFKINALKPVRNLTLTLTTTDTEHHPADSGFLLDLSGATILNQTNDAHVLSIAVEFPGAGLSGLHTAARVKFAGEFHDTIATSTGTFVDGGTFSTSAFVGFVPEPASGALLAGGLAMLALGRRRAIVEL
jgi:hypothetical protein